MVEAEIRSPVANNETVRHKPNGYKEACERIAGKHLWLVPNWDCNRLSHPCKICFATDIMRDAKDKCYQKASPDFFEKAKLLSALPWKDVIITDGEPMSDPQLLADVLVAIDPERFVRIITNGDWALKAKPKEEMLAIIRNSGREVRVEVSAHGNKNMFGKRTNALRGEVDLGVQLRREEIGNSYSKLDFLVKQGYLNPENFFQESHNVLRLGQIKNSQEAHAAKTMSLRKLVEHTHEKNIGLYLMSAEGGTRVIANNDTPYLVCKTPADIAELDDTSENVLRKTLEFYAKPVNSPLNLDGDNSEYAIVAFKSGVPLSLDMEPLARPYITKDLADYELWEKRNNQQKLNARNLIENYCQIVAERSQMSVTQVRELVTQSIAGRLKDGTARGKIFHLDIFISEFDLARAIALHVPSNPQDFASLIANIIIGVESQHDYNSRSTSSLMKNFIRCGSPLYARRYFEEKLDGRFLGISFDDILLQVRVLQNQ